MSVSRGFRLVGRFLAQIALQKCKNVAAANRSLRAITRMNHHRICNPKTTSMWPKINNKTNIVKQPVIPLGVRFGDVRAIQPFVLNHFAVDGSKTKQIRFDQRDFMR